MAEGIIVVTTLLVFFGLVIFTRDAYVGKLDQQAIARRDALFFASHNCEGGGASAGDSGFAMNGDDLGDATNVINEKGDPGAAEKVNRTWNMAQAHGSASVSGSVEGRRATRWISRDQPRPTISSG